MFNNIGLDKALSFINCQLRTPGGPFDHPNKPVVTISRMTGSGGHSIADKTAAFLQDKTETHDLWTIFDRNLVEKVLEDHHLPQRLSEFMPENHRSLLDDTMEEFFGLHPSSWTLVQKTTETIWHLAQMGHVILLGRGANIITSRLPSVVHVRLVGSLESRTQRAQEVYNLGPKAALDFVRKEDLGRKRYLKEHFGRNIDDPLLYDLVINTDRVSFDQAAALIGGVVVERFNLACAQT